MYQKRVYPFRNVIILTQPYLRYGFGTIEVYYSVYEKQFNYTSNVTKKFEMCFLS